MDRVKTFFSDDQIYFNTVTQQIDDATDIQRYWHLLYMRIKYYYQGIRIFWVKEYTKKGKAHLHFLSSRSLDGSWLSRSWLEITGTSYVVKAGNTTGEIRNPAAYMLKYMTKAHGALDMYEKGERIYGFKGAKAPAVKKLGFKEDTLEFSLDQHYNPGSKYWGEWYNSMQLWIGPAFIDYMNYQTLSTIEKLNFESAIVDTMFTGVELFEDTRTTDKGDESIGLVDRNRQRFERWRQLLQNSPGPDGTSHDGDRPKRTDKRQDSILLQSLQRSRKGIDA
jgi:hypothetical protein